MRLNLKVSIIVAGTASIMMSVLFFGLLIRVDRQSEDTLLTSARSIFKNVLITRKWVADHEGVLVVKQPGMEANPYLDHPQLFTDSGDTLLLKNPALVTRELSAISEATGGKFSFHMASTRFINPENIPDTFEEEALQFLDNSEEVDHLEYSRLEERDGKHYYRYFAPLYTREACLSCHAQHGYEEGDLRGGISVTLPMEEHLKARHSNVEFLLTLMIIVIIILSLLTYFLLQRSIIEPLRILEGKTHEMQDGQYAVDFNVKSQDEIGSLSQAFKGMAQRIHDDTEQLKTSEIMSRSLIENSPELIAIIDPKDCIFNYNHNFQRYTGYSDEELKGMNLFALIDKANTRQSMRKNLPETMEQQFEGILKTKDKLEISVEVFIGSGVTQGDDGDLTFVYLHDISERKQIERFSIQAEKMFALGKLSSGIAHEIRNPMYALTTNIEYLKQKQGDPKEFETIYPELRDSIDRIHRIVTAILDYSRPHRKTNKPLAINAILQKALDLVEKQLKKSRIRIRRELAETSVTIEGDEHKLVQVFVNLILNAFQAMGQEGELILKTEFSPDFQMVSVADNGCGIAKEDLDRIFDPFFTKSKGGTGLGLAICQRILDDHDARIEVLSELDLGTTINIYFNNHQG